MGVTDDILPNNSYHEESQLCNFAEFEMHQNDCILNFCYFFTIKNNTKYQEIRRFHKIW